MSELPSEIVDLESIVPHPNLLIFAKSGVGKTVLGTSDDDVLVINTEPEGTISAQRSHIKGHNVKRWNVTSVADMDKVYDWAMTLAERDQEIPFKWFVIDSLTKYQEIDMREILKAGRERKPLKDEFVPEWPDYLKNQKRILRRVVEFNQLPVNMLYTCLVTNHTDQEGNEFLFPSIHGKKYEIAQMVCSEMTSYGYYFAKPKYQVIDGKKKKTGIDRYIMWEDSGSMQGKDRTTALEPWTKNLTLKDIRERIEKANVELQNTETETVAS